MCLTVSWLLEIEPKNPCPPGAFVPGKEEENDDRISEYLIVY